MLSADLLIGFRGTRSGPTGGVFALWERISIGVGMGVQSFKLLTVPPVVGYHA